MCGTALRREGPPVSVNRRRAGEHDLVNALFRQSVEKYFRLVAVVGEIFSGVGDRFRRFDKGGEVKRSHGPELPAKTPHQFGIRDIAMLEKGGMTRRPDVAICQAVQHDGRKTILAELANDMAADIAGAA